MLSRSRGFFFSPVLATGTKVKLQEQRRDPMIFFIELQSSQSGCKRDYIVGMILNKLHVNIIRLLCRFPSMHLRFLGEHSFNRFFRQSRRALPFAQAPIYNPINRNSTNSWTKRPVCDEHLCIKIKVIAPAAHNKQLAQKG